MQFLMKFIIYGNYAQLPLTTYEPRHKIAYESCRKLVCRIPGNLKYHVEIETREEGTARPAQ